MRQATTYLRSLTERAGIAAEDRFAAAVVSAVLYLVAGASVVVVATLPAVAHGHRGVLTAIALLAVASAAPVFLLVRRPGTPGWILHLNQWLALGMIPVVVALTGGASSPLWFYIFFVALFTSYFYSQSVASAYLVVCVVVEALPLLYDSEATHQVFLAELLCAAPSFLALGVAISAGKRRAASQRARAEIEAAEQGMLRRVASAVADGDPLERIFAMVAGEAAALLGASAAAMMRVDGDGDRLTVVGGWSADSTATLPTGSLVPVAPGSDVALALIDGQPRRTGEHRADSEANRLGHRSSIIAPVRVGNRIWGVLAAASPVADRFSRDDERTVAELAELLATSVSSTEERARLAEQALSDSLTGLANQRALQERLGAELARAARYDGTVSVAVIDIDHFKEVNDTAGHDTGDAMLQRVATAFRSLARAEDTVARIGGDEFAWLMPDTRREQALVAVERARRLIAAAPADPYRITISAGICDTDSTGDPQDLLRLADNALYWSKEHGRNQAWIYDPSVVHDLSEQQRAVRLERVQALEGLRALMRAREHDDPAHRGHADRVAAQAVDLAVALGWARERALMLGEAAALHDIGRIAGQEVPVVAADTGIGEEDLRALRALAATGAGMLEGLMSEAQVRWVGGLYGPVGPRTIAASESSPAGELVDGAAVLTVADAYDLLTAVTPGVPERALAELERLAAADVADGRAVAALRALVTGGGLGQPEPRR